jgi:hypothetical protein
MRHGGWLIPFALLGACDGREETALDNLANGANTTAIENQFEAEAMAVMEPLSPPVPGTPGGLPVPKEPMAEGQIAPGSAQGAAQVVQGYYGLLEQKRFDDAQDLWSDNSAVGEQEDAVFARRFDGFSEIHANVGAPGETEGAAGSIYVTVPVQVYARVAATGKPWYELRQVVLRRVNDVPGSSEADRRWHISAIGPYEVVAETALTPISATDGIKAR